MLMHGIFLLALAGGVRDLHQIATKLPMAGDRRTGRRGAVHMATVDCMEEEMRLVTPTVNNKALHGHAKGGGQEQDRGGQREAVSTVHGR